MMNWKDLKLGKKFGIGFGTILLLLAVVAVWSITGINGIVDDAGQVIAGNQLDGLLAQKEVDHLNWANKVNALLTDERVTALNVETDDHKCGFGKWLYGEGRKHAESMVPDLSPLLKAIEEPHRKLHESAVDIGKHFKPADPKLPALILAREIDHLNWAARIRDTFLKNEGVLQVETNPANCALGKWLHSDAAKNAYDNGSRNFRKTWDVMVENHELLHRSAIEIGNSLGVSKESAHNMFETRTLPLLDKTLANLDQLKASAQENLSGVQAAETIFSDQTKPALEKVQSILAEIRNEARNNIMTDEQMLGKAINTRMGVTVFSCIAVFLGIGLAFIIARGIIKPIQKGVRLAQTVAGGDLTQTLDFDQKDEVGVLAGALNNMSSSLREMFRNVGRGVETLTSSSTELSAISQQMSAAAEQTSGKATVVSTASEEMSTNMNSVASASEEASTNVQMVATAAEQMSTTITEIAGNAEKGRNIAGNAVDQASSASIKVDELGTAAREIGKVTETIADISDQTNLLALNATIEAARAGDAGKGFAVVANEIKELAKQTAEATREIGERIDAIQGNTSATVSEIEQVTQVINDVNEVMNTIASSVEEQSIATKEIAGSVNQAAQGIEEVNANVAQSSSVSISISSDIGEVSQAAGEMNEGSMNVNQSAVELSQLAEQLKEMVDRFKV